MGLIRRSKQKDENIEPMKALFDKFEYSDLEKLCSEVMGKSLFTSSEKLERVELLELIWENYKKGSLTFEQVKDFAIKQGTVSTNFFD